MTGKSDALIGLDVDTKEFEELFTSPLNRSASKKDFAFNPSANQKICLIEGKRLMNGQILLKRFRIDHKVLVKQVDKMESIESDGNELRGMMDLLPKDNESSALRSHLPPPGTPQSKIKESIGMLNECEQYMTVMLDIPDTKAKFECMIFRADFEDNADIISGGIVLKC